jgi:hypothetical protein
MLSEASQACDCADMIMPIRRLEVREKKEKRAVIMMYEEGMDY